MKNKPKNHAYFLSLAIKQSAQSVAKNSSPFGAVIVKDGVIIAKEHNKVIPNNDPTAHGEIMCIRKACRKLKTFNLKGCILYSSCEPCPMCLNAAKWANISEIYYAATQNDADDIGFRDKVFYHTNPIQMHHLKLDTAQKIMQQWFQSHQKQEY